MVNHVDTQLNNFSIPEVAFIIGRSVRTVREYVTKQKQTRDPTKPRLVATKNGTMYSVSREELIAFIEREFGQNATAE